MFWAVMTSFVLSISVEANDDTAQPAKVAIADMNTEQLKARIKQLEAELVSYKRLKEENKRLRKQLRKIRTQAFESENKSSDKEIEKKIEQIQNAKDNQKDLDNLKQERNKDSESFLEWLTK